LDSFETIGGDIIKPPKDQIYTIQFEEDGKFYGTNDCNDIGGDYEAGPNKSLRIVRLGTTFAYCGKESMYSEYYKAIHNLYSYDIYKNKLHLYYGNNSRLNFIGE